MKDNWFNDVKDKVQTRVIVSFKSVHEAIVHEKLSQSV